MKHVIEAFRLPFIQPDIVSRPLPQVVMTDWRLVQVQSPSGERVRYLVGQAEGEGAVCAPLKSLRVHSLEGVTPYGRRYRLEGPPGYDFDADYALVYGMRLNGIYESKEMTRALLSLQRRRARANAEVAGDAARQGQRT